MMSFPSGEIVMCVVEKDPCTVTELFCPVEPSIWQSVSSLSILPIIILVRSGNLTNTPIFPIIFPHTTVNGPLVCPAPYVVAYTVYQFCVGLQTAKLGNIATLGII